MVKLRGFIQATLLIRGLFVASIAVVSYLVIAPVTNFELTAPAAHEKTYSSEALPSPISGAQEIYDTLLRLPAQKTCDELQPIVSETGKTILAPDFTAN